MWENETLGKRVPCPVSLVGLAGQATATQQGKALSGGRVSSSETHRIVYLKKKSQCNLHDENDLKIQWIQSMISVIALIKNFPCYLTS